MSSLNTYKKIHNLPQQQEQYADYSNHDIFESHIKPYLKGTDSSFYINPTKKSFNGRRKIYI